MTNNIYATQQDEIDERNHVETECTLTISTDDAARLYGLLGAVDCQDGLDVLFSEIGRWLEPNNPDGLEFEASYSTVAGSISILPKCPLNTEGD